MRNALCVVAIAATVGACAKSSDKIAASYVSPYQYDTFTCPQVADEARRVSARAAQVAGVQDEKATKGTVATTVGVIVFWPALFFIGGNDQQTAELARLRGGLEALDQSQIASAAGFNSKDRRRPEHTCNDQNRLVGAAILFSQVHQRLEHRLSSAGDDTAMLALGLGDPRPPRQGTELPHEADAFIAIQGHYRRFIGMTKSGKELPIRNVRPHGESWWVSGRATGIAEMTFMTSM
jgi:hypothetical protein